MTKETSTAMIKILRETLDNVLAKKLDDKEAKVITGLANATTRVALGEIRYDKWQGQKRQRSFFEPT
jgi:hypothetical protein